MPGGPESSTPWGIRPPSFRYLSGWRRKSTTSASSCLRLVDPGDVGERDPVAGRLVAARARAAERAEHVLHVARPGASARRAARRNRQRRPEAEQQVLPPRRPGIERLRVDDDALLALQQAARGRRVSAKAGISVLNAVVGFEPAYRSFCVNVPWIAVPFDVISFDVPVAFTCLRKNGLYGTRTREERRRRARAERSS